MSLFDRKLFPFPLLLPREVAPPRALGVVGVGVGVVYTRIFPTHSLGQVTPGAAIMLLSVGVLLLSHAYFVIDAEDRAQVAQAAVFATLLNGLLRGGRTQGCGVLCPVLFHGCGGRGCEL